MCQRINHETQAEVTFSQGLFACKYEIYKSWCRSNVLSEDPSSCFSLTSPRAFSRNVPFIVPFTPTILYFDLHFNTANAAHYVYCSTICLRSRFSATNTVS